MSQSDETRDHKHHHLQKHGIKLQSASASRAELATSL
jgi:hypothetical protein